MRIRSALGVARYTQAGFTAKLAQPVRGERLAKKVRSKIKRG